MPNIDFLLVGAGGGGGFNLGGGGGAGELLYSTGVSVSHGEFSVVVGAGGAGGVSGVSSQQGGSSSFNSNTCIGGGRGGGYFDSGGDAGGDGGCGGGGGHWQNGTGGDATGSHTGYAGGDGSDDTSPYPCGGGGGTGAVGQNAPVPNAGAGGAGTANSITGSSVTYGGGGGGGVHSLGGSAGAGGSGGGGAGGTNAVAGTAGTDGLGAGGGGGGSSNGNGGDGGDGVVIVRYTTSDFGACSGGTITYDGDETIHTFTSSGTLILAPLVKKIAGVIIDSAKKIIGVQNVAPEVYYTDLLNDANLQGYWRLEDTNYTDSSSNGYDLSGTTRGAVAGKFGNGIDFEYSNGDYVSIADASCPNLEISGSQTWSCWVKPESHTDHGHMISKFTATNTKRLFMTATNGYAQFNLYGLTDNGVTSSFAIPIGEWSHIVGKYDGSYLYLFINGVLNKKEASTGSATDTNGTFALGQHGDAGNGQLDGVLDECMVYDRALSDLEIEKLYYGSVKKVTGVTVQA